MKIETLAKGATPVTPVKAEVPVSFLFVGWIPAFAGMAIGFR